MSDQEANFHALIKFLENLSQAELDILEYIIVLGKRFEKIEVGKERIAKMSKRSEKTVQRFTNRHNGGLFKVFFSTEKRKGNLYHFDPKILEILIFLNSKYKISRWSKKRYPVTYDSYEHHVNKFKNNNLDKSYEQKSEKNVPPKESKMSPNYGYTSCYEDKDLYQKSGPINFEINKEMWFGILPKTYVGMNKIRDLENKFSPLALKMAITSYRQNYTLQNKEVPYPAALFETILTQKQKAILTF